MIPGAQQWNEIASALRGDLAETSYAVLLAAMARSGKSGALKLTRKPVEKQVFIVDGRPVECRSNLAHEIFGRFLLSEGQLSVEDHNSALSESLSRGIRLGEVLVERELMSPHEVYRNLQKNLARKLLDGFTWTRGSFEVLGDLGRGDQSVQINAPQLILTGVLKLTPQAEIAKAVAELRGQALRVDPGAETSGAQLRLPSHAQRVVQALEEKALEIGALPDKVGLSAAETERIVYALALVGRVALATEIDERPIAPALSADETRLVAEAGTAVPAAVDEQALLLRQASIVESYLSFQRKDSFDFLGLEEGATVPEIDRTYLQAAELYAPWTLVGEGGKEFEEQGEILFLKAAQAYAELRNSESRGSLIYRRKVLRDEEAARRKPDFAIETDLLDSEEQFKKGLALVERGELGKAIELLEFAADCDPQSAVYRAELAYQRQAFDPPRWRKQAVGDLEEAIRIDPKCGLAHYYLGLVLAELDDLVAAEETLRRSIKLMAPDRRPIEALKELTSRKRR